MSSRKKQPSCLTMLDPWLRFIELPVSLSNDSSIIPQKSYVRGSALIKFNPFLSLVKPNLPDSFYATLSIYNAFSLVSCNRLIHSEGLSCVNMDETSGFIMATQGRYPDTVFVSLSRDDWDIEVSRINLLQVNDNSTTLEELEWNCLEDYPRGVDLAFCSNPTEERLMLSISLTKIGGSLVLQVDRLPENQLIRSILENFSRVLAYKPATTSSISTMMYIVCSGRSTQSESTLDDRLLQFSVQLQKLEDYRLRCLTQVLSGVDNTDNCDTHLAEVEYLSL